MILFSVKKILRFMCISMLIAGMSIFSSNTFAADPIEGLWATKAGTTAKVFKCASSYCILLTSGPYSGKRIGKLDKSGSEYKGHITDPENNRKYVGSAKVKGGKLYLKGCAAKIFCSTQRWAKRS